MNSYCVVIPVYNHHHKLASLLTAINRHNLTVFLIDDGSDEASKLKIKKIVDQFKTVQLSHFEVNKGKGAAVIEGMKLAYTAGYSHAFQIDADFQHDMDDIPLFIKQAEINPKALICGIPIYDQSVHKMRYYGRYLTHFWVWVHTLSFEIKDSMCGFRIYPLAAFMQQLQLKEPGQRMNFDTDIIVRMHWQGIQVVNVATHVIYHDDVPSNFKMGLDNWHITKMHTTLFFGMLWRLPKILMRKLKSP